MNLKTYLTLGLLLLITLCLAPTSPAQGTAFTYQGQLVVNGNAASGSYDFRFRLASDALGNNYIGAPILTNAVSVGGGLFTVSLDFGAGVFVGSNYWLQVDVKTNGAGAFTTLIPLQKVMPTPYALYAGSTSNLLGTVAAAGLSGNYSSAVTFNNAGNSFAGNGTGLTNVNAVTLGGLTTANFWRTDGNAGTSAGTHFLGTTDNQPLELRVNSQRALRFEPNIAGAPNVIGGAPNNFVAPGIVGAAIGGGGATSFLSTSYSNQVAGNFGVVAGGLGNTEQGFGSAISGGFSNAISFGSYYATIAGGEQNSIEGSAYDAFIGGGMQNTNGAIFSVISGGQANRIRPGAESSAIGGGSGNTIAVSAARSTIGGGWNNNINGNSSGSVIGGGGINSIRDTSTYSVISGGFNQTIGTNSYNSAVGGGGGNTIADSAEFGVIGGGGNNSIGINAASSTIDGGSGNGIANNSDDSTIGGGSGNNISTNSHSSVIGGGNANAIASNSERSTIGGGWNNSISSTSAGSVIDGGSFNNIRNSSTYSVIGGGFGQTIGTNSFNGTVGGGSGNSIASFAAHGTIGGGNNNSIGTNATASTIDGGSANSIANNASDSTIGGGNGNSIATNSHSSVVGGGNANAIANNAERSTIGGGWNNSIGTTSAGSVIGGGGANNIRNSSTYSVIGGGFGQLIGSNSFNSVIGGGSGNLITSNAPYAAIPGGTGNIATNYAFAAGNNAQATNTGAFVWSDSGGTGTGSAVPDSVTMRARGGFRFLTGAGTSGAQLTAGATSWSVLSDRNMKKDFVPVDSRVILEKLAVLPITQWHYEWEDSSATPNLGPMAQDFKAAFFPGRDDQSITTLETDGVTLAAIQGLNQKVESLKAELKKRDADNADLKQRLDRLEHMLSAKMTGPH